MKKKYNIYFKGILHVGANECVEIHDYERYIPRNQILWIEALPHKLNLCKTKFPNLFIKQAVVSDVVEAVKLNVFSNREFSMFDFCLHSKFYPEVQVIDCYFTETQLLKTISNDGNFVHLSIQGAELKALKGMDIDKVEYIYTKVYSDHVYKDCALVDEMDEYLLKFGLHRLETTWKDFSSGEAFYIRDICTTRKN